MRKRFSPLVVGVFVVGFVLLATVVVLVFGGKRLFGSHARFVVVAKNVSVGGLDPGSVVKLSGVRVGRVESMNVRVNPENSEIGIRLVCDLDDANALAVFGKEAGQTERLIEQLVEGGMQAALKLTGITGLLYIDLEMKNPDERQIVEIDAETGSPIVPLASSIFDEYLNDFDKIANGLASVDFAGISKGATTLLNNLNKVVVETDFPSAIRTFEETAKALAELAEGADVNGALKAFAQASATLETSLRALNESGPELEAGLNNLMADASDTLRVLSAAGFTIRELFDARGGLPVELGRTLDSIQNVADSLNVFVDYLERNPGAIIRGRADTETTAGKLPE